MSPLPDQRPPRRPTRLPLRLELTLWMLAIFAVIQLVLGAVTVLYHRASIERFLRARLETRAREVASALSAGNGAPTDDWLRERLAMSPRFSPAERCLAVLYDANGVEIAASSRPAPAPARLPLALARDSTSPVFARVHLASLRSASGAQAQLVLLPVHARGRGRLILAFAVSDPEADALAAIPLQVARFAIPVGVVAAGLAAWLVAGLAVAPFHYLRRIAWALSPEALETKLEFARLPGEIAALRADLERVRNRLREAFAAQDRFIANVSHELKTPIAILLTEAQTLQRGDLTAGAAEFVRSVIDEMRRLGRMTESFLALTRLQTGKAPTTILPCDVNDFVVDAVEDCGQLAGQYGVRLHAELAEPARPLQVLGDPELLRVMVDNLVRNAIRFSPEGQAVVIRTEDLGTECLVTVSDAGTGVPPELIAKLFDRFTQARTEAGRGHGLGLSIAQGIAELHGGRIAARNLPGGGCEFTVRLPTSPETPEAGAPAPGARQGVEA